MLPNVIPLTKVTLRALVMPRGEVQAMNKTRLIMRANVDGLWLEGDRVVVNRGGQLQLMPWAEVESADVDHDALKAMAAKT